MPPATRRQTIGLVMNVRDEAHVIRRCLESVKPLIDYWTIVDTGSDDATPEIVAEVMDGIPGQLHRLEWRNFGHNRTEATSLAKGTADYLLWMDADMVVESFWPLPHLTAPCYMIRQSHGDLTVPQPLLMRGCLDWKYVGVAHEYLTPTFLEQREPLDQIVLRKLLDGNDRGGAGKYEPALRQAVEEDPTDARSVFYLAQELRDLGRYTEAVEMYERRIQLGGWDEEVWYAQFQKGVCQLRLEQWYEGRLTLHSAYLRRPQRSEPLIALAKSQIVPAGDVLFIEDHCYGVAA